MQAPPPDLTLDSLTGALRHGWGVDSVAWRYLALGFGAHHWSATDDAGTVHFVTVDDLTAPSLGRRDAQATFASLQRAYGIAAALRDRGGLAFVVAPREARDGSHLQRVGRHYAVAVLPYVAAPCPGFGAALDGPAVQGLSRLLGRLHGATRAPLGVRPAADTLRLPARAELEAALAEDAAAWPRGPYADGVRRLLERHAVGIRRRLRAFDTSALRLRNRRRVPWVITHGEPHPGNLLMGASGAMFLVDWDTVRLAPPERDLWWLLEAGPADWAAYRAEGGTSTVDEDAAAFYRERWALTDLALSVAALRRARERTADGEVSWRALVGSVTT